MIFPQASFSSILISLVVAAASFFAFQAFRRIYLHPLSKFPGPWYASATSLTSAITSILRIDPQWLLSLTKKYGTNTPIRVSPTMLLFPKPSALKEIYWDPKCNTKTGLYGSGVLGPPSLFTTLDGEAHRELRKVLGGPQWSIGALKNHWEDRIDDRISVFVRNMGAKAEKQEKVVLSQKVAEFAADIMSMLTFGEPWGFLKNDRDERNLLKEWRSGLDFFGFAGRFRFFRERIMKIPGLNMWLLPTTSSHSGIGWLMSQADREVTTREKEIEQGIERDEPDFLQHCLHARMNGEYLGGLEKRSHITLLIMAGADTTGTAMGSTLRFLATHPAAQARALAELQKADSAGLLSSIIKYEESRLHLPYFTACIKEALRLEPPATNLFARVVAAKEGKVIDGWTIPAGTEITTVAYVEQRDPVLYAPDPEAYRPERWLQSVEKANEMEACSFVFGAGPRVCLGKDIAIMEMYKLVPETLRRFEMELVKAGEYVVAGGVAYNKDFIVKLKARE